MRVLLSAVGRPVARPLGYLAELLGLLYATAVACLTLRARGARVVWRITVAQCLFTGAHAIVPVTIAAVAVGTLILSQAVEYLPAEYVVAVSSVIVLREVTPVLTALILILRSGTAVSIEIAHMKLSNELDALSVMGISFEHLVMLPRLVAMVVSFLALQAYANLAAIVGGYYVTRLVAPITFPVESLLDACRVEDAAVSLVKASIFGAVISLTCVLHGLKVMHSRREVPIVTTQAVVRSMLLCLLLNTVISVYA